MKKWLIYITLTSITFPYYIEFIVITLILIAGKKGKEIFKNLSSKEVCLFGIFIVIESIIVLSLNYDIKKFSEQILLLFLFYITYKTFSKYLFKNLTLFSKYYLNFTTFLSIYSIIGLALGHNQGGRAIGFVGEAGDLAAILLPSIIYYIYNKKINYKSIIIIIDFLLALSAASILALIIIFFIIYIYPLLFNNKKNVTIKWIYIAGLITITFVGFKQLNQESDSQFFKRFQDTIQGLDITELDYKDLEVFNASTYAWLTNIKVAIEAPNRIFGTGLGTHKDSYEKLNPETFNAYRLYGLNKDDAYSIATRVYSELGLIGFIVLIFFIYKNMNRHNVGNMMALGYLLNRLITGGHYTTTGMFLFLFLYYYTNKKNTIKNDFHNNSDLQFRKDLKAMP